MTNETKTPGEILNAIRAHLSTSKKARVLIVTMTRATAYGPKHSDMFKLDAKGDLRAQNGKSWNLIVQTGVGPLVSIRFA